MSEKSQPMRDDEVRVIKIGEKALFEFIYENFIDGQEEFLDLDPEREQGSVTNSFYIDWERREFVFCAYKTENERGELLRLPASTDFDKLIRKMPDTTDTMYAPDRYRVYTKKEIEELCK